MNGNGNILIVDDEPNALKVLSAILFEDGYNVFESRSVDRAIKVIDEHIENIDAIITDLKMPFKDGFEFYEYVEENYPDIPVIFLTAYGTVDSAVNALTNGAFYYFIKPPDYVKLKKIIASAIKQRRLKREIGILKNKLSNENKQYCIKGSDTKMLKIFNTVDAIKNSMSSVLICGETGVGKEEIARLLHFTGIRKDKPFVTVNCAAIPRELLESELFGYEKGAFTGAISKRVGKFEDASGGTIFLDEIGDLELSMQAKLLRVLQEKEIERIGSNKRIKVDFRLVSSTNSDLRKKVQNNNFREDLFYRINVVQLNIPPLRDRKDDIALLVSEFAREFCMREKKALSISDRVMKIFNNYHWPGNIRQLKNTVERLIVLTRGNVITPSYLPEEFKFVNKRFSSTESVKTLKEIETSVIKDTVKKCSGNKSKAAKMLGISRKALYKRVKEAQL